MTLPEGYLADAKGRLVPEHMVRPQELLEDQTVRKIHQYAEELSGQIARFKGHCYDDVAEFLSLLAEQYGKSKGGAKGNITLTSYDGCRKVVCQTQDRIAFGPELTVARSILDEVLIRWTENSDDKIRLLVNEAFKVDSQGKVNRESLLNLRRLDIQDQDWCRAMSALTDSIRVTGSAAYIRFYRRDTPEAAWQAIPIDLAQAAHRPAAAPAASDPADDLAEPGG